MPGKDKTGPEGKGPLTGRQMGICEGANPIGMGFGSGRGRGLRRGFGRGFGRGQGMGFGFRRFAADSAAPAYREPVEFSKEEKIKILEADRKDIEAELEAVKKEMGEIKKQK